MVTGLLDVSNQAFAAIQAMLAGLTEGVCL